MKKEPGRHVGSKYIPNRIFRGKVVDELRDVIDGLTLLEIGRRVCIDWNAKEHREWLRGVVKGLERDELVEKNGRKFSLCM